MRPEQEVCTPCAPPGPPPARTEDAGGIDARATQRASDLRNTVDWVEVFAAEVSDRWRGGTLQVMGTLVDSADVGATYQYALIEVRILGWMAHGPSVLRRGALGGAAGPITQIIEDVQPFTRITVEARKIVDGAGGSAIAPQVCEVNVIGRFVKS